MFGHRKDLKPTKIWIVGAFAEDTGEEYPCRAFRYKNEAEAYERFLRATEDNLRPYTEQVMLY